jgi:hypothetical protein
MDHTNRLGVLFVSFVRSMKLAGLESSIWDIFISQFLYLSRPKSMDTWHESAVGVHGCMMGIVPTPLFFSFAALTIFLIRN